MFPSRPRKNRDLMDTETCKNGGTKFRTDEVDQIHAPKMELVKQGSV
jgi:hypothetical protein